MKTDLTQVTNCEVKVLPSKTLALQKLGRVDRTRVTKAAHRRLNSLAELFAWFFGSECFAVFVFDGEMFFSANEIKGDARKSGDLSEGFATSKSKTIFSSVLEISTRLVNFYEELCQIQSNRVLTKADFRAILSLFFTTKIVEGNFRRISGFFSEG